MGKTQLPINLLCFDFYACKIFVSKPTRKNSTFYRKGLPENKNKTFLAEELYLPYLDT